MARTIDNSRTDSWLPLRTRREQTYQHMSHGPILPMDKPSFLERLLGRR